MIFGQFHRTMLTIHNFFVFMNSIDVMLQIISWYLDTTMLTINAAAVVIWCRISVSCFIFSGRIRLIENLNREISFWGYIVCYFWWIFENICKGLFALFFILLGIFKKKPREIIIFSILGFFFNVVWENVQKSLPQKANIWSDDFSEKLKKVDFRLTEPVWV